ncbi:MULTISPECIES: hypothetical protein [Sphingobacterium]|uniref:Uncharacterized protein n=1 Tax=Sphingobacterium populi TaxID=1812824 RepID=A0ABW5U7R9_9SPHI|nr:hypothetical protein [Sphingobacterium sp. CFCC 11742]
MAGEVDFVDEQYALIGGGEVLVDMGQVNNLAPLSKPPSSPKIKGESQSSEIANWGEDNDFPQKVIKAAEQSTELPALLDWQARALQGKEVVAFQRYFNEESQTWAFKPVVDLDIDSFLQDTTFKRYTREAATDLFWFWNVFPELIKSVDGKSIAYLGTQDASFCRWSRMDNRGSVKNCYVNANWPEAKAKDPETIKYDVVDPYSNTRVEDVQNLKKDSFIYPVSYPSPGKSYYQLAKWNGFLTSGWADIARRIPLSKRSLLERMLSAKYILQIPVNYWPSAYKDWNKLTMEEQKQIKKNKVKEVNNQLTGSLNEGKTILVEVGYDMAGKELPGWKIVPIEQVKIDGNNLEDSREASEHLMRALGVDPTLVGDGPGKKMGGGSGSDKRVAFNIYVALLQPYRDVILEPLYFIAEYNGWTQKYPGLCFKMIEIELETLDKSHSTSKEVVN